LRVSVILLPDAEATWNWRPGATKKWYAAFSVLGAPESVKFVDMDRNHNVCPHKGDNMIGAKIYDIVCGIVVVAGIAVIGYYLLFIRS